MPNQFDLYCTPDGAFVVILQSDLLDAITSRVAIPLVPKEIAGKPMGYLNPSILIGDDIYILAPQYIATLTTGELGTHVGSLAMYRDDITRAVDALLSGV